ncbi:MAG: ubiquinol-cytochrome c reductase iron-sulfur subunit [Nitrospirae bacterium]|nr:ubiquinol-cytochrome c reductase iron-sulfur subunit [Nitrospirota bacterium]
MSNNMYCAHRDPDKKGKEEGVSRRDFLGLAGIATAVVSSLAAVLGLVRFTKATVHYEESHKFKIGKPEEFPVGTIKKLDDKKVFIFADNEGLFAISAICTHLGCIVYPTEWGFQCPCHGSKYNEDGKVIGGPAPRPLPWLEVSMHEDGNVIVDAGKEVKKGTKFKVA